MASFFSVVTDLNSYSKEAPNKQPASINPNWTDKQLRGLRETDKGGSSWNGLVSLQSASVIFAFGVTVALILHIYLGTSLVSRAPLHFHGAASILVTADVQVVENGMLVSDHERCTALGQRVLHDRGSSVDAAIAAVLCLGVVHPHASGIGGYVQ